MSKLSDILKLPRFKYGYRSDEWGMNTGLSAIECSTGQFYRVEDVQKLVNEILSKEIDESPIEEIKMMKSGTYYIGDLCYVLNDNEWVTLLSVTNYQDGEYTLPGGRKFAWFSTAYGDGAYPASNGAELGVDSGTIGCILLQDITRKLSRDKLSSLGTIVEFKNDFEVSGNNGFMKFGHITVNTDFQESDDDYEDEDELCDDDY